MDKVEKKGAPKLPGEKCSTKVKEEVDSAKKALKESNAGQKDAKVRPKPRRVPSRQSKPVDESEGASQGDSDFESKLEPCGRRSAKNMVKTEFIEELADNSSDEADAKPSSKAKRKRPTNSANLPEAVKDDTVTWRVTILDAYRAHIACTDEVWAVNDGTALRHLQVIWDFYIKKQPHKFVANDPVLALVGVAAFV